MLKRLAGWLTLEDHRQGREKQIFELGGGVQFLFGFLCRRNLRKEFCPTSDSF
jgi:hypothetical protein